MLRTFIHLFINTYYELDTNKLTYSSSSQKHINIRATRNQLLQAFTNAKPFLSMSYVSWCSPNVIGGLCRDVSYFSSLRIRLHQALVSKPNKILMITLQQKYHRDRSQNWVFSCYITCTFQSIAPDWVEKNPD